MSFRAQRTVGHEGKISGVGLHTGAGCTVSFRPAAEGAGILFFRKGSRLGSFQTVSSAPGGSPRCTSVRAGGCEVKTVEHLFAALFGLGITNVEVDLDGPEVPGLDGSAAGFVTLFKKLGVVEQKSPASAFRIREPLFCYESRKAIAIYPAEELSVAYVLDYDHPQLKRQSVDFCVTPEIFEKEIAPARTFCTAEEAETLKRSGLGRGATYENTLVVSDKGVIGNRLRFPEECARHKVLDILGDLGLLGFWVLGRVVGLRSGHSLNQRLVERITASHDDAA